jgi:hypothetical protein
MQSLSLRKFIQPRHIARRDPCYAIILANAVVKKKLLEKYYALESRLIFAAAHIKKGEGGGEKNSICKYARDFILVKSEN